MLTRESVGTPEPLAPARGPLRLVSSLRYREWRLLWSGLMFNQTGDWMDSLAISWLVLVQTGSPLALGSVNFVRGIPHLLFSLPAGVAADRFDRRALMIWTQTGGLLATSALAALASADLLEIWHIYVLLFIRGAIYSFNQPARSSLVGDIVPRTDMANAVALHSAIFNGTRMWGPAIAGFLIAVFDPALVLWIHAATYGIALATLALMTKPPQQAQRGRESAWATFVDGFVYLWREPVVLGLLLLGVVPFLLGQPYQSMLPVFAKDVLLVGSEGLGLLMAAGAVGGLVGAFVVAGLGDFRRKGLVMVLGMTGFALLIVLFAASPWPLVSAALLFSAGMAQQVYSSTNSTLMLLLTPSEYRGRVMAVHQLDRGFIPVGSFLAGAIAEVRGAPFAVGVMSAGLVLSGLLVLLFVPRMRRLE